MTIDKSQAGNKYQPPKLLIRTLFIMGIIGLAGFICALVAMITHYSLFSN